MGFRNSPLPQPLGGARCSSVEERLPHARPTVGPRIDNRLDHQPSAKLHTTLAAVLARACPSWYFVPSASSGRLATSSNRRLGHCGPSAPARTGCRLAAMATRLTHRTQVPRFYAVSTRPPRSKHIEGCSSPLLVGSSRLRADERLSSTRSAARERTKTACLRSPPSAPLSPRPLELTQADRERAIEGGRHVDKRTQTAMPKPGRVRSRTSSCSRCSQGPC